jgi:hypothetical protein
MPITPAMAGRANRRIEVQISLDIKKYFLKIIK